EAVKELFEAYDAESDEELDEVPDGDVSDKNAAQQVLQRAA
ncbi:hypothetical protein Tco_0614253, partial [Tanacetum coccineum]